MSAPNPDPETIAETIARDMTLWGLCLNCGKATLHNPRNMRGRLVDAGDDRLVSVAKHMESTCQCRHALLRLVPTPRSMIDFAKTLSFPPARNSD